MDRKAYEESAMFEHRFWLQVLGDHARFIKDSLSPDETAEIPRARAFIRSFDQLLEQARRPLSNEQWVGISRAALQGAQDIRAFKLHLIARHLSEGVKTSLPPSFFNHMVNEVEEAIRVFTPLSSGLLPPAPGPVHLHLHWLLDAVGHSTAIRDSLDPVEKKLKSAGDDFAKSFEQFYMKAVEIAGLMRTNLQRFPAFSRFNKEVELEVLTFKKFLRELEGMELRAETLGTLSPLMPDHMAREECYYLWKLSLVSEVSLPLCDPAKPRTEG